MASDQNAKLTLPTKLVKELHFQHKRLLAGVKLKEYGLSYSEHGHDGLVITGAPFEVLLLAEDHLKQLLIDESLKKQNKENPECFLFFGKVKLVFFDEKADRIWSHRDELISMDRSIEVDKYPGLKRVIVVCSYSSYPNLKWKLEHLMLRSPVQHPNFNSDQKSLIDKSYHHSLEHDKKGQSFSSVQAPMPGLPFQFQCKRILVHLNQGSIEKIQGVDAIVNAVNEDLNHIGGVAFSIYYAAGQKMNDEFIKHVKTNGPLKVSENVVTTAGNLKYKGIIHCVGPKWTGYHHQKEKCEIQLNHTIVNILHTADKHNFSKIAMPAISADIYGVPKDICANVYVRAIIDYSQQVRPSSVTEVHFVDINPDFLLAIKTAYENWRKNPDDVNIPSSNGGAGHFFQLLKGHPGLPFVGACHMPCEVHYMGKETMSFGGQQTIFKVDNTLTVRIYSGSIVKVSGVDALVCNVGSNLKGGKLAEVFESAGGASYAKALYNLKRLRPSVGDVVVLMEPGSLKSKYILLAIMESKRITVMDAMTAQKLKDLYAKILETANAYGMKRIALPLLGSGLLVNDALNLECCCNSLLEGLTNSRVVRGICVEDIQVLNVHPKVTDAIVGVFTMRSSQSQAKNNFESVVDGSNSSGGRMPEQKKQDIPVHCAQLQRKPWEVQKGEGKKERGKYGLMYDPSSPRISQDEDDNYNQGQESRQSSVDDAKVKTRSEQLPKNTVVSVTTSGEKDTEVIKLEQKLRDLEAKKIVMLKEKRKKELEEKIRQAEEDLRVLSAGTKQEQSNKSTPPLSSLSVNRDREEIQLEQKLRELEEKKVSVLKERKKQELKEKIKQLEEDLSTVEAVPPKDAQVEAKRCIFCTDVLRNPKKLGCGHEFCSKCFDEAFEFQEACPVCGTRFGEDDDNQQGLSSDALLSWYNSSDFMENS